MKSGTQQTTYHIEHMVQSVWERTIHEYNSRTLAKSGFAAIQERCPTGWYRLVSVTVLETVTP